MCNHQVNLWAGRTPAKLSRLPERVAALLSNVRATRLGDATPAPLSTAKRKTQSLLKDGEWRDLEAAVVEPRRAGGASGGAPPRARLALQVSGLLPSASGDEEGGSSRGRGVQEKAAPALALVKAARVRLPSLCRQRIDAAARELAHAGGDARLVREALLRVLPPSERAMLVEATRRGCGGEGEAEPAEDVAEAQEEAVEWVCGVPLLVHLALQGLEACALCALPQLDRHKHVDAADADGVAAGRQSAQASPTRGHAAQLQRQPLLSSTRLHRAALRRQSAPAAPRGRAARLGRLRRCADARREQAD